MALLNFYYFCHKNDYQNKHVMLFVDCYNKYRPRYLLIKKRHPNTEFKMILLKLI